MMNPYYKEQFMTFRNYFIFFCISSLSLLQMIRILWIEVRWLLENLYVYCFLLFLLPLLMQIVYLLLFVCCCCCCYLMLRICKRYFASVYCKCVISMVVPVILGFEANFTFIIYIFSESCSESRTVVLWFGPITYVILYWFLSTVGGAYNLHII